MSKISSGLVGTMSREMGFEYNNFVTCFGIGWEVQILDIGFHIAVSKVFIK